MRSLLCRHDSRQVLRHPRSEGLRKYGDEFSNLATHLMPLQLLIVSTLSHP